AAGVGDFADRRTAGQTVQRIMKPEVLTPRRTAHAAFILAAARQCPFRCSAQTGIAAEAAVLSRAPEHVLTDTHQTSIRRHWNAQVQRPATASPLKDQLAEA